MGNAGFLVGCVMPLPLHEQHALITAHLPHAERAAKKFTRRHSGRKGFGYDDFLSAAHVGLVMAANSFDPARNVQFSTYAYACMEGQLHRVWLSWKRQNGWGYAGGRRDKHTLTRLVKFRDYSSMRLRNDENGSDEFDAVDPNGLKPFETLAERRTAKQLLELCRTRREHTVVCGLSSGMTYQEVADRLQVSRQRVHQIWKAFRERAKEAMAA